MKIADKHLKVIVNDLGFVRSSVIENLFTYLTYNKILFTIIVTPNYFILEKNQYLQSGFKKSTIEKFKTIDELINRFI